MGFIAGGTKIGMYFSQLIFWVINISNFFTNSIYHHLFWWHGALGGFSTPRMPVPRHLVDLLPPSPIHRVDRHRPPPICVQPPSQIHPYSVYDSLATSLYTSEMMNSCYTRFMDFTKFKKAAPSDIIDDTDYNATQTSYNVTSTSYNTDPIFSNTSRANVSSPEDMPALWRG